MAEQQRLPPPQRQDEAASASASPPPPTGGTVSLASIRSADVAFEHGTCHLVKLSSCRERLRAAFEAFVRSRPHDDPLGRVASRWTLDVHRLPVSGVVVVVPEDAAAAEGGGSASSDPRSSTSSGQVPRPVAVALAEFVRDAVTNGGGRFLEQLSPKGSSDFGVLSRDRVVPRVADHYQHVLRPIRGNPPPPPPPPRVPPGAQASETKAAAAATATRTSTTTTTTATAAVARQQPQPPRGVTYVAPPIVGTVVSLGTLRHADVAFAHMSSYLLVTPGWGNSHERFRAAFSMFLRAHQTYPEGRMAAHWTLEDEELSVFDVVVVTAPAPAASRAAATGSTVAPSSTSSSSPSSPYQVPAQVAEAFARFVLAMVLNAGGRFLEPSTPPATSSLREVPHDAVMKRLGALFQRRLKPILGPPPYQHQPGGAAAYGSGRMVVSTTAVAAATTMATKKGTTTAKQLAAPTTGPAHASLPPPPRPKAGPMAAAPSRSNDPEGETKKPGAMPPPRKPPPPPPPAPSAAAAAAQQPTVPPVRKRTDLVQGIPAEASAVAYVHNRAVNVDAHAVGTLPGGAACDDGEVGGGAGGTHNMYALLRSWVRDDPYRKVVEGDLLDYETVDVPVFESGGPGAASSTLPLNRSGAPQSTSASLPGVATTSATPSTSGLWECLADGRRWQRRPVGREPPPLSALTEERTLAYRQRRKAHKRALRAKDRHVLEAMRKRGIHVEPRRR